MTRKIIEKAAIWETVEMVGFEDKPIEWLFGQMHTRKLKYLLAHAYDGVIWGRLDGEELITSHNVDPKHAQPLRVKTLQTVRIFAPVGELLVWRNEADAWTGRLITETIPTGAKAEWTEAFDEHQILWGTNPEFLQRDFTRVSEGTQGLIHVVPLNLSGLKIGQENRPLRLVVRHYLKEDDYRFVRVNTSRLLNLLPEPKESNT